MASGCQEIDLPKRLEEENELNNAISESRAHDKRLVGSVLRFQS